MASYWPSSSLATASCSAINYLTKCIHRGSTVNWVVCGHLRSPSSFDFVFGKETSIELLNIGEDGTARTVCDQIIFGSIKYLAILPMNGNEKDMLIVFSDSGKLSFLTFCNEKNRFSSVAHVPLSEPGNYMQQVGRKFAVDSTGRFIAICDHEGQLCLFSLSMAAGDGIIDKRTLYPPENESSCSSKRSRQRASTWGTIWSMCFLSNDPNWEDNPVLAIVLKRERNAFGVVLLRWNIKSLAVNVLSQFDAGESECYIVEVPHSPGFAFLFRGNAGARLMDLRVAHMPRCVFNTRKNIGSFSWEPKCDGIPKMIFCCTTGQGSRSASETRGDKLHREEIFMIEIYFGAESADCPKVSISDCLYSIQPCRFLKWVNGGFVVAIVAPELGDSQVLKVENERLDFVSSIQSKIQMEQNMQKFHLGSTLEKVLYHSERELLILLRNDLREDMYSSDICCVDLRSRSVVASFQLAYGERGHCMELVSCGKEQVLVIGTSCPAGEIMHHAAAERHKGRLVVLCIECSQNSDSGLMTFSSIAGTHSEQNLPFPGNFAHTTEQLSISLKLAHSIGLPGMVLAVCPYQDRYFLASADEEFYVIGFPNNNPQRVSRFAIARTSSKILSLTAHLTRIAVGTSLNGILFYSFDEKGKWLTPTTCDSSMRSVAACVLTDVYTAVVSDGYGRICVLSCVNRQEDVIGFDVNEFRDINMLFYEDSLEGDISDISDTGNTIYWSSFVCPQGKAFSEQKLTLTSAYYLGDINVMSMRKSYCSDGTIIARTRGGSTMNFIPISREEYEFLEAVQDRLIEHPLTAPVLGNVHNEFRSRENPVGVPKMLDGDMLAQFLELTSMQQEDVLSSPVTSLASPIPVNKVIQLLERVLKHLN